jgi:NAD(P)-dependent dehydrogenase (short-subunit alcohol dehydrogenase family)
MAGIRSRVPGAALEAPAALDTGDEATIRAFAAAMRGRPVHMLVLNAGQSLMRRGYTERGVGALAQVNYLGHYLLVRLLEAQVAAAAGRVVAVASATHRFAALRPPEEFLFSWAAGGYPETKLAQARGAVCVCVCVVCACVGGGTRLPAAGRRLLRRADALSPPPRARRCSWRTSCSGAPPAAASPPSPRSRAPRARPSGGAI